MNNMSNKNFKLYLDMDGVIVDWDGQFKKISNGVSANDYEKTHGATGRFELSQNASPDFYATMQWLPDGKQLYNFVKQYDSEILSHAETSGGDDNRVVDGKRTWLKNNNVDIKANLVPHREDKAKYANKNAILIDDREDNVKEFIDAGGIGVLHKNTEDTIQQLKKIMENADQPLIVYNSTLNPVLWDTKQLTLKPEVADKLLKASYAFYTDTKFKAPIKDIVLIGSSTGYNWNPTSDIDVQIIIDFDFVYENKPQLVKNYVAKVKELWKQKHDIMIKNHEVEFNIKNIDDTHHSESSYSLKRGEWIQRPVHKVPTLDKEKIKEKYRLFRKRITDVTNKPNYNNLKSVLKDLYALREQGLDDKGEYSAENLAFKLLRKNNYLDKLKDAIVELTDKNLSIPE